MLSNRLLNIQEATRREMSRLDADPGGSSSRVRLVIDLLSYGMQNPSLMSPGMGLS